MQKLLEQTLETAQAMKNAGFPITGLLGTLGEMFTLQEIGGRLSKNNSIGHDIIAPNGEKVEVKTYDYDSRKGGNIKVRVGTFERLFVWCYLDGKMLKVLDLPSAQVSDRYKVQKDGKIGIRAASLYKIQPPTPLRATTPSGRADATTGKTPPPKTTGQPVTHPTADKNITARLWAKMNEFLPETANDMYAHAPDVSPASVRAAFQIWKGSTVKELRQESHLRSTYSPTTECRRRGWLGAQSGLSVHEITDQAVIDGAAHMSARSACRKGYNEYRDGKPLPE